jgi:hypothetical protein
MHASNNVLASNNSLKEYQASNNIIAAFSNALENVNNLFEQYQNN